MSSIRKKLNRFLSGKASPEGTKLYDAWYRSFDDTGAAEDTDPAGVARELADIKQRPWPHAQRRSSPLPYWRMAAAVVAVAIAGVYLYDIMNTPVAVADYTAYTTQAGQRRQVTLADGTSVWLNAGTVLRAPEAFRGGKREVYLSGEGYFEVARDRSKPFIIHTGELTTTVLGTVFNVRNYDDQPTEVAVVSGKVSVAYRNHAPVVLTRGKMAAASNGILGTASFDDFDRYDQWKDGKLVLENRAVKEVLHSVNRFYGVDIRLKSEQLNTCFISTTLEPMAEQELVDLLCLLLNATAHKEEHTHTYWISGSGCH